MKVWVLVQNDDLDTHVFKNEDSAIDYLYEYVKHHWEYYIDVPMPVNKLKAIDQYHNGFYSGESFILVEREVL